MNIFDEYVEVVAKIKELTEKKAQLSAQVQEEMTKLQTTKVTTTSGATIQLTTKQSFKYSDEPAIIMYLKNNNLNNFFTEVLNAKVFNAELKSGTSTLAKQLAEYYTRNTSTELRVTGGK